MDEAQFVAHAAHEDRHWWFVARRRILVDIITQVLGAEKDPLVVDVGCGTGGTVAALAGRFRTVGVDPSASAIELARSKYPECEFLEGRAPDVLAGRLADVRAVVMSDVLEHVEDDSGLLGDIVKRCAPGTWFVLTVPADMTLWSTHDEVLGHYRRYDPDLFAALWQSLPVSCHLLAPLNTRLEPLVRLAAGTDLAMPSAPMNYLLYRVFAGERRGLLRNLKAGSRTVHGSGVSLIAVLRREAAVDGDAAGTRPVTRDAVHEVVIRPRPR
jgi:trans-aconitate methyltransferase